MKTNQTTLQKFGHRVRELRLQKGLSQETFAELCHLDRTYISSLERGKRNVCFKNIVLITRALEVSLSELFVGFENDD
jgi:transcriptional regulator with XRE-family HTH domain